MKIQVFNVLLEHHLPTLVSYQLPATSNLYDVVEKNPSHIIGS